ncbi:MAG: tetratricopeptide repeat protein [Acidobacteriota bacterium]|nr:tetratricopeptide repeat protein [Acidobacteriota bacterium]
MVHAILAVLLLSWATPASGPTDTESLRQALVLFNSGKYQECFELASTYLRQNPNNPTAHKLLGMDEYMRGNSRDALREVTRATELSPKDPEAFYYLGRLYFSADNAVAALAAFQQSLELDPSSVRAYNHLGQTYEALGRRTDAEQAYQKGIELEKNQPKKSEWPYYNLGVLYLNSGRPEDSVACFRQALVRDPAFADAKVKLAVALSNQKPSNESLQLLEEAIHTDPHNAEAHYRLALLLTKSGKREEAQEQFALFQKYRKP